MRASRAVVLALALASLSAFLATGCVSGALYYHVTEPLDVNFDATPVHPGRRGTSHKRLVIPYPWRMEFDWGSTAIADGMAAQGMTKAWYADVETRSFLGIWTQRWIHVYGE